MYEKLSKTITEKLINNKTIEESEKDIYCYSFEVLLSTIMSTIIIILSSLILKQFYNTLLYFIGFSICRSLSGGYHAKNHYSCFILTQTAFISFMLFSKFTYIHNKLLFMFLINLFSFIVVLSLAPIDNVNKPLDSIEKQKLKIKSRIFISINFIIMNTLSIFSRFNNECNSFSLGVFAVSLLLVIGHLNNKKRRCYSGKN